jgi:F420-dependent oxidoreductase-like protein
VKIGLQIPSFTWPGGAAEIAPTLARIGRAADEAGFAYISVMDHFFQIGPVGPVEQEMLEAYTTLGYLAAHTERATLLTLVSGVIYRYPGILAKTITTLDVLSGGRAMLGVGAGWNEEESRGLGIPFQPVAERFEQLEDALKLCLQMWRGDETAFHGTHVHAERPLNSPQALSTPHPPIMVGGGGEKKTLRMVAKYAQACNLFPGPDLEHKLDVLRQHCADEGRDYDEIEKTAYFRFDVGENGEKVDETLEQLRGLAERGVQTAIGGVENVSAITPLEIIGREVIPAAAKF